MDDCDYYSRRAEQQLELAQQATDPAVCQSHYALANLYLEKACPADEPPSPGD